MAKSTKGEATMARLRGVPRSEVTSPEILDMYQKLFDDRDPVSEPGTASGTPGDWWTIFAQEPELFHLMRVRHQWQYSPNRVLDPVLREIALARTGWMVGSQFVFSQKCKSMRNVGIPEEKVTAIPTWSSSTCFTPVERLVLAYTEDLVLGGRVPEERMTDLKESLSEVALLELTFMVTTYIGSSIICRALHLEYDKRPDPVVEVPAPGGQPEDAFA